MIERIGRDVRAAVEDDGADVIVLGCTCMAPAASALTQFTDAPVINPLDAVFLQIELLVRLGLTHSPRAYLPAADTTPVREAVRDLARLHGVRDRRSLRLEPPPLPEQLVLAV